MMAKISALMIASVGIISRIRRVIYDTILKNYQPSRLSQPILFGMKAGNNGRRSRIERRLAELKLKSDAAEASRLPAREGDAKRDFPSSVPLPRRARTHPFRKPRNKRRDQMPIRPPPERF
jgi:hypothetical protein